jgi:hypothetical protein
MEKKIRKKKQIEEGGMVDLGVFTQSPLAKKTKVATQKNQNKKKKNDERFYMFKKFAKDVFNDPLTLEDFQRWSPYFKATMTLAEYKRLQGQVDISMIEYVSLLSAKHRNVSHKEDMEGINESGLMAITDFIHCTEYMAKWQVDWLVKLGWTTDTTGYSINTVSFSSAELMTSGVEWLGMVIKLSCRMIEFASPLSPV